MARGLCLAEVSIAFIEFKGPKFWPDSELVLYITCRKDATE